MDTHTAHCRILLLFVMIFAPNTKTAATATQKTVTPEYDTNHTSIKHIKQNKQQQATATRENTAKSSTRTATRQTTNQQQLRNDDTISSIRHFFALFVSVTQELA